MKLPMHVLLAGLTIAGCQAQIESTDTPVPSTGTSQAAPDQISLPQTVPLPEIFGKPPTTRSSSSVARTDPSGTWKWKSPFDGTEYVLRLEVVGNQVSGTLARHKSRETPIFDGYFVDGELTFRVTRERNDGERTIWKYSGRVMGDTIRGTLEFDLGSGTRQRSWEAIREKS